MFSTFVYIYCLWNVMESYSEYILDRCDMYFNFRIGLIEVSRHFHTLPFYVLLSSKIKDSLRLSTALMASLWLALPSWFNTTIRKDKFINEMLWHKTGYKPTILHNWVKTAQRLSRPFLNVLLRTHGYTTNARQTEHTGVTRLNNT